MTIIFCCLTSCREDTNCISETLLHLFAGCHFVELPSSEKVEVVSRYVAFAKVVTDVQEGVKTLTHVDCKFTEGKVSPKMFLCP